METRYEVTARNRKFRRGGETYVTHHDTPAMADEWVILDSKYCGHMYGYEIMTERKPDPDDCWHRVACRYWLDGNEVTETKYLEGMNIRVTEVTL